MPLILLVDDNDSFRRATDAVLRQAGYRVHAVRNGLEATRCFPQLQADLVITDLIMPEKDGIETIMELRQRAPGLRIIAMSGGGRIGPEINLRAAAHLGATRVLAKPFDSATLLDTVEAVLAESPQPDRLGPVEQVVCA